MSKVIITATPPTPNGDLHVGHVSGPYLAADVHARFLRSRGVDVAYISSSDDNQSYVVTTAQRMKRNPRELAAEQASLIRDTLAKASIAIDAFTIPMNGIMNLCRASSGACIRTVPSQGNRGRSFGARSTTTRPSNPF
jgi:methionyl-tRNA synthetase